MDSLTLTKQAVDSLAIHPVVLRLKNRSDFLYVQRRGRSITRPAVILQYKAHQEHAANPGPRNANTALQNIRVGFTATKRIGKAHVRNRAKRRLKEAIKRQYQHIKLGYSIVLVARNITAQCSWQFLCKNVREALSMALLCAQEF